MHICDPYNVFLAIATNIPQRLKTGFVVQGHISDEKLLFQSIFCEAALKQYVLWIMQFFLMVQKNSIYGHFWSI